MPVNVKNEGLSANFSPEFSWIFDRISNLMRSCGCFLFRKEEQTGEDLKNLRLFRPCHAFGEGSIPRLGYMDRKLTFKGENFLQTSITFFFTFSGTAFRY